MRLQWSLAVRTTLRLSQKSDPSYLFPPDHETDTSIVDMDAVLEVCEKCNVEEEDVHAALLSRDPHDNLVIAYHLIIDNKRLQDDNSSFEVKDFYLATSPPRQFASTGKQEETRAGVKVHPERMPGIKNVTHTLDTKEAGKPSAMTPMKRAKWHLGIRSQSRPHDIMNEVYRAMKSLSYECKVHNPYHLRVRRKNPSTGKYVKMSLQLYQVDQKSYLLDFKSLDSHEENNLVNAAASADYTDTLMETDEATRTELASARAASSLSNPPSSPRTGTCHSTLEFFEMCASLITTLAR